MRHWLYPVLGIFLLSSAALHADENAGMALLEKMTDSAKNLNYEGIFTYQSGKKLQSIRIYHRSDSRGELERLISLNGAAREVIRSNDMVTCITPDDEQVNIRQHPVDGAFPSDLPRRLSSAMPYYKVDLGNRERVADRNAQELLINPVDSYRYGYRLWVDDDTHLLLKSELMDEKGDVLETFTFSSLNVNVHIPEHKLRSRLEGQELTKHRDSEETPAKTAETNLAEWQTGWLPEGFEKVTVKTRTRAGKKTSVEQRVFSDGLSSVSVFIEKVHARHNHLQGTSHVGAINAYGTIIAAHFVTVVGEVPARTVEKIGNSITYTAENSHD